MCRCKATAVSLVFKPSRCLVLVIVEFSASASFRGINGLETRTLTISPESNCTFTASSNGFLRSMTVKTFATSRIVLLVVLGCIYFGCPTRHAMRSRPSSLKNMSVTFLSSNQIGADDSSGFVGMTLGIVCYQRKLREELHGRTAESSIERNAKQLEIYASSSFFGEDLLPNQQGLFFPQLRTLVSSPQQRSLHLQRSLSMHLTLQDRWITGLLALPAAAYMVQDQEVLAAEMERTFIAIKPDGGLISEIISRFERKGFKLVGIKVVVPSKDFAQKHYHDLKERPFFNGLCDFLSSGPVIAMVTRDTLSP
uniref:nucleoside-diphosphate kinase n=1 Tax=Brassica oleracea var. oleracea TaxID=109376 RepID=A0A0D3E941_BRAOL